MDYTQFLSMTEELSLLAVIVILFLADLFLCGKDEKELSACTADGASLSSCGCNFRTAFSIIDGSNREVIAKMMIRKEEQV